MAYCEPDLHLCFLFSWLPAPLPEPWLLQPATNVCVPLGVPGVPLWGGGSRAGVHPGQRHPEAHSTRHQPFPERPTTEKALRKARNRHHQGPDPTTCDHQTTCPYWVSDCFLLLIIARKNLIFPHKVLSKKTSVSTKLSNHQKSRDILLILIELAGKKLSNWLVGQVSVQGISLFYLYNRCICTIGLLFPACEPVYTLRKYF